MKFSVCVTFKIVPKYWDEFMILMNRNATTSLTMEKDCLQFDVCTESARPNEVFLYEVYASPEAFDVHLRASHFKSFDEQVSKMIEDKQIKTYSVVN